MSFATTTNEGLANFLRDTNKSYFFYNDDINNFLSEIYKKAVDLKFTHDKMHQYLEGKIKMKDEEYQKLCDKNHLLFTQLTDELSGLHKRFEKDLRIN